MAEPTRPEVLPSEVRPQEVRRPGKKSIRWDRDPEILARLPAVAAMMLRGARVWQIAEAMLYSDRTAKEDMKRVRTLWREEAGDGVSEQRDRSVAHLREVQAHAWAKFDKSGDSRWLRVIREAEADIIRLQGTSRPIDVNVSGEVQAAVPITFVKVVSGGSSDADSSSASED